MPLVYTIKEINIEYIQGKLWIAIYSGWLDFMRGAKNWTSILRVSTTV
jgi:hypothetical protein